MKRQQSNDLTLGGRKMRRRKRSTKALVQLLILAMICTLFQINNMSVYANDTGDVIQSGATELHTLKISPSDDSYVRASNAFANSNFGKEKSLVVKKGSPELTRESYMKFDFTDFSGEVESVTLVVYGAVGEGSQASIQLHSATNNDWTEETITWNNKPSYTSDAMTSITLGKEARGYEANITDLAIDQLAADKKVSIAFVQPEMPGGQGLAVVLNSKESDSHQPYVEVKYRAPVDHEAPVWPNGSELKAIQTADDTVELQWTPAIDDQMVVSYRIYQNDVLIATVPVTQKHYHAAGLAQKQTYAFRVEAGDSSGNWSQDGPEAVVTMPSIVRLPVVEDTHVNSGSASQSNYGTSDKLIVKNMKADPNVTRQAFMKFEMEALPEEVGTATLNFYGAVSDGGGSEIDMVVYGLEDHSWKEAEMTWITKPNVIHFLNKVPTNTTWKWHQVDVTTYVKDQMSKGETNASFGIVQLADVGLVAIINSKENTENRPYLSINSSRANAAAPSWPTGSTLQLQSMEEEGVAFQWGAAVDPTGVTQYRIYQNGTLMDTISSQEESYFVEGLIIGERYTYKVEAGNAAGEWSQDGPILTVTPPDTKFKQTVLGNVFLNNEPVQFIVETVRPNVSWKAFNLDGTKVAEGTAQAHNGQATITVPDRGLGYFTLEARAEKGGSLPIMLETTYSVLTPFTAPANGDSPFGMNTHLHRIGYGWNADLVKLVKYAGASFVRDGIEWQYIEKEKGVYTYFPDLENYMARLKLEGIPLLFVAAYNNQFYDNNGTPYTDEGRLGMANYAKAYVEKYKDQIFAMNVYNEFNGGFGKRGNSPANSQPEYYFELLKKTYEVVHAEHPDLPIVGIVSAGISLDWIEKVLELGGMDYLDAIAVQEYVYPNAPEELAEKLEDLKTLIKKYNDGKLVPIWLTEFGWPTFVGSRGINEKLQANYLLRGHVIALSSGVEKMMWYDLMDDGMIADLNEDNFGMIRNEKSLLGAYTAKPAYLSYAVMTRELTDAQFEEVEAVEAPIHSYRFVQDQQPVRVVWATEDTVIQIAADAPIEITDMMGNTELYSPLNGKIMLSLTGEPYYVKGHIGQIAVEPNITISGAATVVGDEGQFAISMTNTGKSKLSLTMDVEGKEHPISIEPGQTINKEITVMDTRDGYRYIPVYLMAGGQKVGKLGYELKVEKAKEVKVRPIMEQAEGAEGQYKQSLHIDVANFSKLHALDVQEVEWSIGNQSGKQALNTSIEPQASKQINIPLPSFGFGDNYKASVLVKFSNSDAYRYEGNFGFNPVTERTVKVNGEIEPELEATAPTIDLEKGTQVLLSGFSGKIDVRGKMWMNYDRDHLYLTAQIKDEIHSAKATGNQIWNNDSLQFAISSGVPGESSSWYEIGLSDTPEGPQMYRFAAPPGIDKGAIKSGKLVVKRDEEKKITVYQMSLPWSELAPVLPLRNEVMSFSLLVNDNNGEGRRGWMEWGSGIGLTKRASLFRTMQWMHTKPAPVAVDASYRVKAGEELRGMLKNEAASAGAVTYEIVTATKQGTIELIDPATGEFLYVAKVSASGEDQFRFRVYDGYGYSNMATVKLAITSEPKPTDPPVFPGGVTPNESFNGELYVPAGMGGEVSKGQRIKLSIPKGATTVGALFKIEERKEELPVQKGVRFLSPVYLLNQDGNAELSKPVVLRIAYEGQLKTGEEAVLARYDEQQKAWVKVGGKSGELSVTADIKELGTFAVAVFAKEEPKPQKELADIAGHWGQAWIERAVEAGLITGFPDHTYRPDQAVTRQELVAILTRGMKLLEGHSEAADEPAERAVVFTDDAKIGKYALEAVQRAVADGWITGYKDGSFRPQGGMTRIELAAVLARISASVGKAAGQGAGVEMQLNGLKDAKQIPLWAQGYVAQVLASGLMEGTGDGQFKPLGTVTRAEAAAIAVRMVQQM
ncbi:DNRLRE domain-containing protein [Paenibacillus sp. PAMC21692]|uniref:CBM96 family carbohydrate-binding protein n=1 Tax=Paenibacillus sp. PAMC21692 TaxID=2762320 RepID=UPI00164E7EFD|nr:DNRLRE domain-containing protein [Paenibacillus sp. PAMC21692]QNK56522.1 DNRLRE domain-containing protein [Paenibacillus sp. PAMC21692]